MDNVVFIEFFNKNIFPPGKWKSEPDFCYWTNNNLPCIAIRDMSLGVWRGFVGVKNTHKFYSKSYKMMMRSKLAKNISKKIYGGICGAGKLPSNYKEYNKDYWWISIGAILEEDILPLTSNQEQKNDPSDVFLFKTYKDLVFFRKEINKLSEYLSGIK